MNTRSIFFVIVPLLALTAGCNDPFGTEAQADAFEDAVAAMQKQQEARIEAAVQQALAEKEADAAEAARADDDRQAEIEAAVADALAEREAEEKTAERRVIRPTSGSMSRPTGSRTASRTGMTRPTR